VRDFAADAINVLDRQMRSLHTPNVVVYTPAEIAGGFIVNVRMETQEGLPPKVEVFGDGSLSKTQFEKLLNGAHQPSAKAYRDELRDRLMPSNADIDSGKTVLFLDIDFYGLLPRMLGADEAGSLGSLTLGAALLHRTELGSLKPRPADFTAFMGYPETESDRLAVFGTQAAAKLETWQMLSTSLRTIGQEHGLKVVGAKEMKSLGSEEKILAELENAKGIIFILAHTQGCHVRLPGGEVVELTPSTIAGLKLKNSPFVVLRICNGVDGGYASAFMRAGASAVWANRGVISAEMANQHVTTFLKSIKEGQTALEAIRSVEAAYPESKPSLGLFTKVLRYVAETAGF